MDACYPDKSRTAGAILSYLSAHPAVQDTAEDIARWWRLEQKGELQPTLLKEILADLVTQGLIKAHPAEDGTTRYSVYRGQKSGQKK